MPRSPATVPSAPAIGASIRELRGQRVLLDQDLARLYGVPTKAINQAVARNPERFPGDFAFPLSRQEIAILRSQSVTSRWGGRRHVPIAFTEQGVAMLSSVLRSPRAAKVNVAIMRAFVCQRQAVLDFAAIAERLAEIERKVVDHDERIAAVFDAIRELLRPVDAPPKERIGFAP